MDEIAEGRIEALHAARLGCEVSTLREPGVHVVASRAPALQLLARGRVRGVAKTVPADHANGA